MTMRIALLEVYPSDYEFKGYRQLRILAEHLGTPLEHFVFTRGAPDAAANLPAFLESSVGFLARAPWLLSDPTLAGRLVERVRCGSRLAILASPDYVPDFNRFLLPLGIETTTLGIVKGASSWRDIEVDRTRCPHSFRDLELFDGVSKLLVAD